MSKPTTIGEWADYIAGLGDQALYSQAVAANSHQFARTLVAEGLTMQHVEQIMLLFVRQLRATGTKVPGGGAWDLVTMALTDPVARQGVQMSEEEAALTGTFETPQVDDFDEFELEAEFED